MNRENANPFTELDERLRFETLLADLSSKFVNLPAGEVDREIMDAQRRNCEFLDLDLLVLWQLSGDAAMQALGSYKGGTMLFLGFGTGLGSALMVREHIVPMEVGALSYRKRAIEDHLGARGRQKLGKRKWRKSVAFWVKRFTSALLLDDVVIGGGNAKKLKQVPPGCRLGSNANAFLGGFRMWEPASSRAPQTPNGLVMTRQRKRKEHAHEENQLIADGTPAMEGARCPP